MKIKNIIIILFSTFNISLLAQSSEIVSIDLINPIVDPIPMSRLFSKVEYVPLETTPECRLNEKSVKYYLTEKYIIGVNLFDNAYLFDRKTGRFIREISKRGRGADEYQLIPVARYGLSESDNVLFFDDREQWKGINLETNKTVIKIVKPKHRMTVNLPDKELNTSETKGSLDSNTEEEKGDWLKGDINNPWKLAENKFVGFVNNTTGGVNVRLVFFNKEGEVTKSIPNFQRYDENSIDYPSNYGQFYSYKNNVYFKELAWNDTIYLINHDTIVPHIVFQTGQKRMLYEYREYDLLNEGNYVILFAHELDHYVLFNYCLSVVSPAKTIPISGYYDKDNKQTYVCNVSEGGGGFQNDLDGLMTFNPVFVNSKGEVLGTLSPKELLEYCKNSSQSALSKQAKELLNKISADSNPVIVIAYPK